MDYLAEELSKNDMPTQEEEILKEFCTQLQQEKQSHLMATSHDSGDGTRLHSVKPKEDGEHLLSVTFHRQHVHASLFVFHPCSGKDG